MPGFFITGTDTGVGKTRVAAALLQAYGRLGYRCVGMKPVAAGASLQDGVWRNEDVELLRQAGNVQASGECLNPYLFRAAIAPHIAAEHKGVNIELARIRAAYTHLTQLAEVVVVEGAGGLLVPLSPGRDMGDLAVALGLPLVLVVGMRLGCLNHALLTWEAIQARNLRLAGWVANRLDPSMAAYEENLATLVRRLPVPLLAELPHQAGMDAASMARLFAPKRLYAMLRQG
ncbi:MAG TPA: dethiobiotin synthase [Thiobacillaceae bacterium]|nr:dethiobiotin synthase [Thiobacillaceae bacterium]HNU64819.1 dethiobiotin synthase [Thiobacillaceae bacterium]